MFNSCYCDVLLYLHRTGHRITFMWRKIVSIMKLLKNELMLAFSTASSEAVLPTVMRKMERFGVPRDIASFVLPTGYSFNLDGAAMYQSIAALFVAQLYGVHLSIGEQIILMITLMLTSKGMAGVLVPLS